MTLIRFPLVLCLLLLFTGCSLFRPAPPDPAAAGFRMVPGVPFRLQEERDDCGPAALASLLAHRGREIPVADIRQAVYSPALGGTLLPDMENFARRQGFVTRSGRGQAQLLRQTIDAGQPVVVPIQAGSWGVSRPHFLVVYGYDDQHFLVHAGTDAARLLTVAEFLPRWEKMGRLYLHLE
ncbi:MAG: C39 family peptidase [Desulfofustis sp.]|nr:C39 family peptidase [Desulfofustis sp.]